MFWKGIPVLAYHKVSNQIGWGINNVPVRFFYNQMKYLYQNGFQTITAREIFATGRDETDFLNKIVLTFDDGDISIFENAFPIMKKFRFTGTVFIITDFVGKPATWDANPFGSYALQMNWQQINTLLENGWEIGSHTTKHVDLTSLSKSQLGHELKYSRLALEDKLQTKVLSISYPFSRFNRKVLEKSLQVGYEQGFVMGSSNISQERLKKMALARLGIYLTSSLNSFRRKIKGDSLEFHRQNLISLFSLGSILWKRLFR